MKTVENYNVKIYTDNIEDSAREQIKELLSIDVFSKCKIRIMPDVHAGAGCVIGFTGNLGDKVIPNIVGVDIGCGILVQPFVCVNDIDYHALNEFILHHIPSGRNYRGDRYAPLPQKYMDVYREAKDIIKQLRCYRELKETKRLNASIGSLGGGNHFIELDKDEYGMTYLVIHTGSRNLGKQVAQIYQKLAIKCQSGWTELMEEQNRMIAEYKAAGRKDELQDAIRQLHNSFKMRKLAIPPDLSYLEGAYREDYLYDMRLCQHWAKMNRSLITNLIMDYFISQGYVELKQNELAFESVHNYIGDDNIIRKGAIAAYEGQKCIIPLNMRDGSLICIGKGNAEWNCSAPHGAGRIMSRSQAFKSISMDDYRASMQGIYSESLSEDTKDESPMVYKPKDEIIGNIRDTVSIVNVIKPVYNFKAAE
ncbi:RtcB family protein [Mediterranea massiliensis]|uniref:3'-phosphate/5'-hydroxy nucleic acid ligase n=1 Tax=Mediterranea massiliensis TaxID=1841865 RepID=A0ABS2DYW5_9BACT|nr:RtcB family protein [Mediterranea massiliensis]MBM6734567.1 RtcB family protein [Mediterranea massiliensis]